MSRRPLRKGDPRLAVGYVRVSTGDQALGVEAQAAAVQSWAAREGLQLLAVFVDRLSGATPVADRPGLQAALAFLSSSRSGVLASSTRCRLARSPAVADSLESAVSGLGARVRTSDGASDDDADSTTGLINRGMRDIIAAVERAEIRRRTREALDRKRARGELVGGVPYGFRVVDDGRVSKVSGRPAGLEPVESEQAVIRQVVSLRDSGLGSFAICSRLTQLGVLSRSGKPFSQPQIVRILARR